MFLVVASAPLPDARSIDEEIRRPSLADALREKERANRQGEEEEHLERIFPSDNR